MLEEKPYLTLQEVAALLGITTTSCRKLVKNKILTPAFMLGYNYAFHLKDIEKFKASEFVKYHRYRSPQYSKFRIKPPTQEELKLLDKDLRDELNRTQYCKEKGITRQRLQLKIYSIAYRKLYFQKKK